MKKSLISLFSVFLLISLFICGCGKNPTSPSVKPNTETRYIASIKIEDFESKGELFYDEKSRLHLLHTDPTSPLFTMEEIFDEEKIKTNFKDLEYEKDFHCSGTGILKNLFDILISETGKKTIENGEKKVIYCGKDYNFSLSFTDKNSSKQKIFGNGWDNTFEITFSPVA